MNTVPEIKKINAIDALQVRPVFFLNANGSTTRNLVVKGEKARTDQEANEDTRVSISWGSKLMKNVQNKLVNTKHMTPAEFAVFKAAVELKYKKDTVQYKHVAAGRYNWVKMPYVDGLSDADLDVETKFIGFEGELKTATGLSPKRIKDNIVKFSNDAVWRELGRVVAVDIFNGNSDRFGLETGNWVNQGNVMFLSGGQTAVIGLDTYDPNFHDGNNLNKPGTFPALQALINPMKRLKFAELCCASVGRFMKNGLVATASGPELSKTTCITLKVDGPLGTAFMKIPVETMDKMFLPFVPVFAAGIEEGAGRLKTYLQNKVRQSAPAPARRGWLSAQVGGNARPGAAPVIPAVPGKKIPQGILDRMAYLGW